MPGRCAAQSVRGGNPQEFLQQMGKVWSGGERALPAVERQLRGRAPVSLSLSQAAWGADSPQPVELCPPVLHCGLERNRGSGHIPGLRQVLLFMLMMPLSAGPGQAHGAEARLPLDMASFSSGIAPNVLFPCLSSSSPSPTRPGGQQGSPHLERMSHLRACRATHSPFPAACSPYGPPRSLSKVRMGPACFGFGSTVVPSGPAPLGLRAQTGAPSD